MWAKSFTVNIMLVYFLSTAAHGERDQPSKSKEACSQRWARRERSPVVGIIAGAEHTGTTVMAWQIKNMPGVWSGFECGFLMGKRPADFAGTYWAEMLESARGHPLQLWNVSADGMRRIIQAECHINMYEELLQVDGFLRGIPGVGDNGPVFLV